MKTEQTTTAIFTLPSGIEVRITNADPRDVEWLSGIERAVAAERERCAKVCEDNAPSASSYFEIAERLRECAAAIRGG